MLGIITAVHEETDAILKIMPNYSKVQHFNLSFYIGKINEIDCTITEAGVGKINAARCTQLMIDKYSPSMIFSIGSAGALDPSLDIGDVVISTSCIQHDVDLTVFGYQKGFISGLEDRYIRADSSLVQLCKDIMENIENDGKQSHRIVLGPIATGDKFCNSPVLKRELWEEFGTHCVEMEGAAIAQVCYHCKVPFVDIRSISDKLESEDELVYFDYNKLASERCADFVNCLTARLNSQSK